jgi:hypothetical protein
MVLGTPMKAPNRPHTYVHRKTANSTTKGERWRAHAPHPRLDITAEFKDRLVCDIGISQIRALQRKRLKQGLGHRSLTYEVGMLRQILKTFRRWHNLSEEVDWLRET